MNVITPAKKAINWKRLAIEFICYAHAILFIYAGLYKWLDFQVSRNALAKSPLIGDYAGLLVYLVPAVEMVVAVMLLVPRFRQLGLWLAFVIMASFTAYIWYMLTFVPDLPCVCGGIMARMGWEEHLVFNSVFTLLGTIGIVLQKKINH